jgi:hypothetical protein
MGPWERVVRVLRPDDPACGELSTARAPGVEILP